jgi:L-ascorbate metabolism protein UlaG (beta-lactamase superfamily)
MQLTWLDSNSWLWEIAGKRILLDPWLVGSLVFGNQTWLFQGEKPNASPIPENIDLILLSQGLEDHAHPPTLEVLDHQIPVVASPQAAKVVQRLGYSEVTILAPGAIYRLEDLLTIKAVPGSLMGPQAIENAYIVEDLTTGHRLYYEPHGNHHAQLQSEAPIDVVITPVVGISLLHFLPVLKGQQTTLELCKILKPQVVLPTAGAGEAQYKGVLTSLLKLDGTIPQFQASLQQAGLETTVFEPQTGKAIALSLKPRFASPV